MGTKIIIDKVPGVDFDFSEVRMGNMYVLELKYGPIAAGGPSMYIFVDEDGNENINDIPEKVTEAFRKLEATIQYMTENCDCTDKEVKT